MYQLILIYRLAHDIPLIYTWLIYFPSSRVMHDAKNRAAVDLSKVQQAIGDVPGQRIHSKDDISAGEIAMILYIHIYIYTYKHIYIYNTYTYTVYHIHLHSVCIYMGKS